LIPIKITHSDLYGAFSHGDVSSLGKAAFFERMDRDVIRLEIRDKYLGGPIHPEHPKGQTHGSSRIAHLIADREFPIFQGKELKKICAMRCDQDLLPPILIDIPKRHSPRVQGCGQSRLQLQTQRRGPEDLQGRASRILAR
jgi:hypothetical protein